jgi:hypothetical protein
MMRRDIPKRVEEPKSGIQDELTHNRAKDAHTMPSFDP